MPNKNSSKDCPTVLLESFASIKLCQESSNLEESKKSSLVPIIVPNTGAIVSRAVQTRVRTGAKEVVF